MTISGEMQAIAARATKLLADPAAVAAFLRRRLLDDGGFADRAGKSDLYYTVFGLQASAALGARLPADRVRGYLEPFGRGEGLDLVHASCLARCWSCLPAAAIPEDARRAILGRVEACGSADGGYAQQAGQPTGSAYGCFLALGALQDLGAGPPDAAGLARCLAALQRPDGAYANDRRLPIGSVPATAAAVTVLHHLGRDATDRTRRWLLAQHLPTGGFLAVPAAPEADLLATATALHALHLLGDDLAGIRQPCLRFVRSLSDGHGGFVGHAADTTADCEYTYYALLALGHLAG